MQAEWMTRVARVVLVGSRGQLGAHLAGALSAEYELICLDRSVGDLTQTASLAAIIEQLQPQIVVNAAAYTAVDRAESETGDSHAINAVGPGALAEVCARIDALLLHISTDYVFDGRSQRPYRESDRTGPLNQYGLHKREGEERIMASGARHIIARTALLYAAGTQNFAATMLRLATEREELQVVADQWSNPTYIPHFATALEKLLRTYVEGDEARRERLEGLYHIAAPDACSRFEFVRACVETAAELSPGLRAQLLVRRLVPVESSAFPLPARRPERPVLDTSRLRNLTGIELPPWREGLKDYVRLLERRWGARQADPRVAPAGFVAG